MVYLKLVLPIITMKSSILSRLAKIKVHLLPIFTTYIPMLQSHLHYQNIIGLFYMPSGLQNVTIVYAIKSYKYIILYIYICYVCPRRKCNTDQMYSCPRDYKCLAASCRTDWGALWNPSDHHNTIVMIWGGPESPFPRIADVILTFRVSVNIQLNNIINPSENKSTGFAPSVSFTHS